MGSEAEPAKQLLPYLQRADELQKHEPLVAYYCRLYAMEKGLRIPQKDRTKTTNSILVSLINQLEKDKKSIKLGPEDNLYVEGFASNVFAKADKQDRAGRADLNTAKTFYAASIFFEVLNQFNEVQPDIEQRQKYAIWKAADIRKALKEGRRPEPGPPGGDKDLSVPSSSSAYDLGRSESISASQPGGASSLGPDTSSGHHVKDLGRNESFPASYSGADFPASQPGLGRNESFPASYSGADFPASQPGLGRNESFPASQPGSASPLGPDTSSGHHVKDLGQNESFPASYSGADFSTPHVDNVDPHGYTQAHLSPSSYSAADYPSSTFHQPPSASRPPPPDQQQYPSDQHSLPQTYHPPENPIPPYTYPNFQTYPSFQDSTLPTAPSHQSYYNGPDTPYSHQSAPPATDYPSTKHYDSTSRNDSFSRNMNHGESSAAPVATYAHDPNYLPPVEKITEAHKAARFAVGALAFDDVPVAVEFLRRSLELLTNPSAESH